MSSKSTSETCDICTLKYNKLRYKTDCLECDYIVCNFCFRKYLLSLQELPKCMNCNVLISMDRVVDITTKKFCRQLRDHISEIDLQIQMSLLPLTQPIVEKILEKKELDDRISEHRNLMKSLRIECDQLNFQSAILENQIRTKNFSVTSYYSFKQPCPGEECNAFLNEEWHCSLCKINVCSHCRVILEKGIEHECIEDDIKAVEYIKSKTKPCPTCGVRIVKIHGCDHMFCTQCNTGYSWKTGIILKENENTNPHYYEWVRNNNSIVPRNPLDNNLEDRLMNVREFNILLHELSSNNCLNTKIVNKLFTIYTNFTHIKHIVLDNYRTDDLYDNEQLRISFLMNGLNKDEFKDELKKNRKKIELYEQIYRVIDSFINDLTEQFVKIYENRTKEQAENSYSLMKDIIKFYDTNLNNIKDKYSSKISLSLKGEIYSHRYSFYRRPMY